MVLAKQVPMRAVQIYEFIRSNGWNKFLKEVLFWNRKAIVVEEDLSEARFREEIFRDANVEFVELHPETFSKQKIAYGFKNRYLKAMYYFERGYGCHALVRGNEVIGDIWYYAPRESNGPSDHVDLHWLGITLGLDSVYSFDIYFVPAERGKNLSAALQSSSMYALHQKGYKKAMAYYWVDNIPAVWNTRVINGWKEMKAIAVSRFFLFRRGVEINSGQRLPTTIRVERGGN
jgi:hypothetical protein